MDLIILTLICVALLYFSFHGSEWSGRGILQYFSQDGSSSLDLKRSSEQPLSST